MTLDTKALAEALATEQVQRDELIAWRNRFPEYWYRRNVGKVTMRPENCFHSAAKEFAIRHGLDSYVCECGAKITALTQSDGR